MTAEIAAPCRLGNRNEIAPLSGCRARLYVDGLEVSGARLLRHRSGGAANESVPSGESARVAAARARAKVRRYAVSNGLDRLLTLTLARLLEPVECAKRVRLLIRRCNRKLGPFPYIWVLELGKKSARLHVHMLCQSAESRCLAQSWALGEADTRPLDGLEDVRAAAHYISKDFDRPPIVAQRYFASRRFNPRPVVLEAETLPALLRLAEIRIGWPPAEVRNLDRGASFSAFWKEAA